MGLGFVGLAMATVLASARDAQDPERPCFRVVGLDLPQQQGRLDAINRGELPFQSEDLSFAPALSEAVLRTKNLIASSDSNMLALAEVIVLDINLDIDKTPHGDRAFVLRDAPFRAALQTLGKTMSQQALLLIETTVPPGFCRHVAAPILKEAFAARGFDTEPLIAHSYERVMPGKDYLNSIRAYFRSYSALTPAAEVRARQFLESFIATENAPLRRSPSPEASELAKIMENAYRSTNIALIYEWTLLAEKMGVNLYEVVEGIRVRKTHANIMKPGFGVGGYCLTKDALLAQWSAQELYDADYGLPFSLQAIAVNDVMPLHVSRRIADCRSESELKQSQLILLGVSYREDVGDTRYSPAEVFYRDIRYKVANLRVHDPYLQSWPECPEPIFIENLDPLKSADIIVLGTRHRHYLELSAQDWLRHVRPGQLWVDANDILDDTKIAALLKAGAEVIGVGKGHIPQLHPSAETASTETQASTTERNER